MNQFVGFSDSDAFLKAIDVSRSINLNISTRHGRQDKKFGMAQDSSVLTMSQVQGDEVIYFEFAFHRYAVLMGKPFDIEEQRIIQLSDQVRYAVEQYLIKHDLTWRSALVSMPLNCIRLEGEPTFLKYDKDAGYSYREPKDVRTD